jgi:hypothetical protein
MPACLSATKALATVRKLIGPALPRLGLLGAPGGCGTPEEACALPAAAG